MLPKLNILRFVKGLQVITRSVHFQTRNPPEPHYDRKRMLEVCKPIYLQEQIEEHLTCSKNLLEPEEKPHPYEVILSKEVKEYMEASKMILIYHVNSLTGHEKNNVIRQFFKKDMSFQIYNSSILKLAFEGTKYQAILQLFDSYSGIAFSPEVPIIAALKLDRILNEKVILLAGIIENRFYSKSNLTKISQVLKRNVHGEMVQQLSYPAASISNSISYQTNLLSHYLSELSKDEKE